MTKSRQRSLERFMGRLPDTEVGSRRWWAFISEGLYALHNKESELEMKEYVNRVSDLNSNK